MEGATDRFHSQSTNTPSFPSVSNRREGFCLIRQNPVNPTPHPSFITTRSQSPNKSPSLTALQDN